VREGGREREVGDEGGGGQCACHCLFGDLKIGIIVLFLDLGNHLKRHWQRRCVPQRRMLGLITMPNSSAP
jgi:hypothetical protein